MDYELICIYHHRRAVGCMDGFCSAWVVHQTFPTKKIHYIPMEYGDLPPDAEGLPVLVVDLAFKAEVLLDLAKTAKAVIVLDHETSFREEYLGFLDAYTVASTDRSIDPFDTLLEVAATTQSHQPVATHISETYTGCELTWKFFHGDQTMPYLVKYIGDSDNWRFLYPKTKAITQRLTIEPYDFHAWDAVEYVLKMEENSKLTGPILKGFAIQGDLILHVRNKMMTDLISNTFRLVTIEDYTVPVMNCPPQLTSDILSLFVRDYPFAVAWYRTKEGYEVSFRSTGEVDVGKIAKTLGGGGRESTAGALIKDSDVPYSELLSRILGFQLPLSSADELW